jgi:hypothetical protein
MSTDLVTTNYSIIDATPFRSLVAEANELAIESYNNKLFQNSLSDVEVGTSLTPDLDVPFSYTDPVTGDPVNTMTIYGIVMGIHVHRQLWAPKLTGRDRFQVNDPKKNAPAQCRSLDMVHGHLSTVEVYPPFPAFNGPQKDGITLCDDCSNSKFSANKQPPACATSAELYVFLVDPETGSYLSNLPYHIKLPGMSYFAYETYLKSLSTEYQTYLNAKKERGKIPASRRASLPPLVEPPLVQSWEVVTKFTARTVKTNKGIFSKVAYEKAGPKIADVQPELADIFEEYFNWFNGVFQKDSIKVKSDTSVDATQKPDDAAAKDDFPF